MDKELQKFKHVLEYFVAHQNYLQSSESSNIQGYVQYIKPLIDSQSFYKTGQGYNDNSIQRQISQWEDIYPGHTLCINIQPNYGNYTSKKCYLNWSGTGINIFCKWGDDEVTGLSIGYAYWWKKPIEYKIIQTRSIKDLNLYNSTSDNDLLKGFYQSFINEIRDYDNRQGEYFLREKDVEMMEKYGYFVDLLRSNHNLILTGAPGTGKTYLAKQIAEQMGAIGEQCGFVQFHPSYDYTDFIEGLRPIKKGDTVGFERKDGVFKAFCKKALTLSSGSLFDTVYDNLIQSIRSGKLTTIQLKTKPSAKLDVRGTDSIGWYSETEKGNKSSNVISRDRLKKLYEVYNTLEKLDNLTNINEGIQSVIGGCDSTYYWGVLHHMLKQPFVFIIDEINRGDISKIFGELFYSIDPEYRGKKGRVDTQYQNLIPKEGDIDFEANNADAFRYGFYVPENVYIIGTMNDIDRSIESMDFAMRRRFAFREVTVEDRMEMIKENEKLGSEDIYKKIKARMTNLNLAILTIQGLSTAYQIGAAYFLKLENYLTSDEKIDDNSWDSLWNNHLHGLLFEYLRGLPNADEDMETLLRAYKLDDKYKMENKKVTKYSSQNA